MTKERRERVGRELGRQHREAEREWVRNAEARREVTADMGRTEHVRWGEEIHAREAAAGRRRNIDYGVEYELPHPDGGKVRYDYVDLQAHRIVDRKPAVEGERVARIAARYEGQRRRHVEAYEARFHVTPTYEYSFYPAPRDLFGSGRRSG